MGLSTGPFDAWLPGADRQTYNAIAEELNVGTLRSRFGGSPTEGERAANRATLPSIDKYENVNMELLAKIREEQKRIIEEYEKMAGAGSWSIQAIE